MAIIRGYDAKNVKIKMLLIGEPKTGKSLTAASFPKPVVFDFEDGWQAHSARYPDVAYGVYMDRNPAVPTAFMQFKKDFDDVLRGTEYETIVLDTLGSLQTIIKNRSLAMKRYRGKNGDDGLGDGIKQLTMEDWNYVAEMTKHIVERACASDKNVIVTSHVITRMRTVSDESGEREVPAQMLVDFSGEGKEKETFQKRFDIFAKTEPEIKTVGSNVTFVPRLRMKAVGTVLNLGSRWDCFGVYEAPTYDNLMAKITAYNDELAKKAVK